MHLLLETTLKRRIFELHDSYKKFSTVWSDLNYRWDMLHYVRITKQLGDVVSFCTFHIPTFNKTRADHF